MSCRTLRKEIDRLCARRCNEQGETEQSGGRCAACTRQRGLLPRQSQQGRTNAAPAYNAVLRFRREVAWDGSVWGREQIMQLGSAQQAVQVVRFKLW